MTLWCVWFGVGLLRADGEDLLALDFDFDAEGWADVAALNDGAAHPDVAGKIGRLQGIVESAAAGVAYEGVIRARKSVVITEPVHVGNVFELAGAIGSLSGKGPIAGGKSGRASWQADNRCRYVFTREAIAHKKVSGGPGLGKIGYIGDDRVRLGSMGQQRRRIRGRRRNLNLGGLFSASGFRGLASG